MKNKYIPLRKHSCKTQSYNVGCKACIDLREINKIRKEFENMMKVTISWDESNILI